MTVIDAVQVDLGQGGMGLLYDGSFDFLYFFDLGLGQVVHFIDEQFVAVGEVYVGIHDGVV